MFRVILAEDEEQLRNTIANALKRRGFEVSAVSDGLEALKLLRTATDTALLLTDIMMPNLNGYQLTEAALTIQPGLRVLMMTPFPGERLHPNYASRNDVRLLVKTSETDRVCDLVLAMLWPNDLCGVFGHALEISQAA